MADHLDLVRKVYKEMRRPSQDALPWESVLEKVASTIARYKLDLVLSPQNDQAQTSRWFNPTRTDFALSDLGLRVLMPIRMETRPLDSELEKGMPVPIVNYDVLDTSTVGAVSFYGDPIRIAFRDESDFVCQHQYRLVYESDFEDSYGLDQIVGLPEFFNEMVVLRACYDLALSVEDESPEWMGFMTRALPVWEKQLADRMLPWQRYVTMFKGRAQVPKRTFFANQRRPMRTRYFRG